MRLFHVKYDEMRPLFHMSAIHAKLHGADFRTPSSPQSENLAYTHLAFLTNIHNKHTIISKTTICTPFWYATPIFLCRLYL